MIVPVLLLVTGVWLTGANPCRGNPLLRPETPNPCEQCTTWNRPHPPVHMFGNTWWVGVDGLSVIAIDTSAGVILLDGALAQSVPLVKASLISAGLKLSDVKLIGNSHTHFDHAGGIAELQRESGAKVMASAWSAGVLRSGCPSSGDPQAAFGCRTNGFPPVKAAIQIVCGGDRRGSLRPEPEHDRARRRRATRPLSG